MNAREAAWFMRAFGDGTRVRIVAALSSRELSVWQLSGMLRSPKARTSRHLRYLHARGVVEAQPVGNSVVYRLAPPQHRLHQWVLGALQQCASDVEEVCRDAERLASTGRANRNGAKRQC